MSDQWVTSKVLAAFLAQHRDNDVKVSLTRDGDLVPIKDVFYHRQADVIVIEVDTDSEDYKTATAFNE